MNVSLNRQILDGDKIHVWAEGYGFAGFVPSPIQPKKLKPYLDWCGAKITLDEWQRVLAFFKAHAKDEVQVRLYLNPETGEWKAHAFPQEYPRGMTTKEIPGHPNAIEDGALFPEPWVRMGSVHHHCSSGAFQSGTDRGDEETVCGIHITMGKLDQAVWDIHSRVSVRIPGKLNEDGTLAYGPIQAFYDADLTQWFDLPETWKEILPRHMHGTVLKQMLVTPPDETCVYPDRWKDNLIRPNLPNGNHHGAYQGTHYSNPNPRFDNWRGGTSVVHGGNVNPGGVNKGGAASGTTHKPSGETMVNGVAVTNRSWQNLSHKVIEQIAELIEVYVGEGDVVTVQVIETTNWEKAGFVSLLACEHFLRQAGFTQITGPTWGFAHEKAKIEEALRNHFMRTAEAEAEARAQQVIEFGADHADWEGGAMGRAMRD